MQILRKMINYYDHIKIRIAVYQIHSRGVKGHKMMEWFTIHVIGIS